MVWPLFSTVTEPGDVVELDGLERLVQVRAANVDGRLLMALRAGLVGRVQLAPDQFAASCPGSSHISVETLSRAGALPSSTFGAPGTHGERVAGMHGMGVSTPSAAAVAAATTGLAGDMHIPNGIIFVIGM
jgi:hypothetical protein